MTTAKSSLVRLGVGDPTPEYSSLKPIWDRNRAVCSGERFVKEMDSTIDVNGFTNLLIPFSPSMTQNQYNFYKAEAELPGIVAQFSRMLVGGLLRKQPVLVLPESLPEEVMSWIVEEFGTDGSPLTSFMDAALWEEMQTSNAWVYVSYPNLEDPEQYTKEERKEFRPFPVLWSADTIINVRTESDPQGGERLKHVILRGYSETYDPEDDEQFHPQLTETVWVHELDPHGHYQIRTYVRSEAAEKTVINGRTVQDPGKGNTSFVLRDTFTNITVNGERLKFIPAWPLNGSYAPREPVLTPLVDKEVALYNKISRRNHLLYGAATYTPYIKSDMHETDFDKIVDSGLGSWFQIGVDDEAGVLDTPTEALADMDRAIADSIEEMARLGVRMMTPETAQSGIALQLRNASQTAQLGTLNTQVSNTMRQIIAFMISWRYGAEVPIHEITFTLSGDFDNGQLGIDWMRLATEWYESNLIPRSVWLTLLQQNDMLPPEYDDVAGQKELNEDDIIPPTVKDVGESYEE